MESAIDPHVHNFPRSGNGCWCGAQQCAHVETITKPGDRPYRKRCRNAVATGRSFCEEHARQVDRDGEWREEFERDRFGTAGDSK